MSLNDRIKFLQSAVTMLVQAQRELEKGQDTHAEYEIAADLISDAIKDASVVLGDF